MSNENITPAALLEQLVYVDTFMPEIDDPSQLDERLTAELSAFADESFIFPDEEKPAKDDEQANIKHENTSNDNNNNNSHHELLQRFNEMNNNFSNGTASSSSSSQQQQQQPLKTFNTLQQTNSLNTGISNILSPLQHNNQLQNPLLTHGINSIANNNSNNSANGHDLLSNLPKVPVPPGAQSSLIAAGLSQTQIDALAALIAQHQGGNGDNSSSQLNRLINPSQSLINPEDSTSIKSPNGNGSVGSVDGSGHSRSNSIVRDNFTGGGGGDVDMDKRRRNTAASARFRIKKKLKEQQLERNVRELNELTITLEKKIQTLEMENKLLRNLVVEKGEQKNNDELELLKKRAKQSLDGNEFHEGTV